MKSFLFLSLLSLTIAPRAFAVNWLSTPPSSAWSGQTYNVSATHTETASTVYTYIYKNGAQVMGAGNGGPPYSTLTATAYYTSTDSGTQTIYYRAEGWSDAYGWGLRSSTSATTQISIPNAAPVGNVSVNGYANNSIIYVLPGGSATVAVNFSATDANGNLSSIRTQSWNSTTGASVEWATSYGVSGSSATITRNQTLTAGDWYFWTDPFDTNGGGPAGPGSWGSGFHLKIAEASVQVTGISTNIGGPIRPGTSFRPRITASGSASLSSVHIWFGPPPSNYEDATNAQCFGGVSGTSVTYDSGNSITAGADGTTYTFYARAETNTTPHLYSAPYGPVYVTVQGINDASFVSQSVPTTVYAGQTFGVSQTWQNSGSKAWTSGNNYNLGSQNPQDNTIWGTHRYVQAGAVGPGGSQTYTWNLTAPTTPGTYNFQSRWVQDGVEWFGGASSNVTITVLGVNNPTFNSYSASTPIQVGTTATASWSATDPDGDLNHVDVWVTQSGSPYRDHLGAFGASGSTTWSSSAHFNSANGGYGSYLFVIRATDNRGGYTDVNASFDINRPPVLASINSSPATVYVNSPSTISATTTDPDGNLYAQAILLLRSDGATWLRPAGMDYSRTGWSGYAVDAANGWSGASFSNDTASGSSTTKTIVFTPTNVGSYRFYSDGNDGYVWTSNGGANAYVTAANRPTATAMGDASTINLGQSTILHAVYVTDALHGDPIVETQMNVYDPTGAAVASSNGGAGSAINYTLTPTTTGNYTYQAYLRTALTPGWVAYASGTVSVAPQPVSFSFSNTSLTYNGSAQGPTINNPSGATFTVTGASSATNTGGYNFTVTATGNYSGSATCNWSISKAAGTVTLSSLSQVFNGTPRPAPATTTPAGMTVNFTYDGSSTPPTNVGGYAVVGTINNSNYTGSASGTLSITPQPVSFSFSNTSRVYTGSAQGPTINNLGGATYTITGTSSATTVGSYSFVVTATGNYSGSATCNWNIAKATGGIALGSLSQVYNGSPRPVSAVTTPVGMTVDFTYNGSGTPPTNVGSYVVVGTINNPNYAGSVAGNLTITPQPVTFSFTNTSFVENGTTRSPTINNPSGATYSTSGTLSAATVGNYSFTVTANGNYSGTAPCNWTITAAPVNQTPLVLTAATTQTKGTNQTLGTTGGSGGGAVTFVIMAQSASGAATLTGPATLTANVGTGWVDVQATKEYDTNYNSATSPVVRITFAKATATVTLGSLTSTYDGSSKSATATTVPAGLTTAFTYDGIATSPTNGGSYAVVATISNTDYQGSASGTLTIAKAAATVTLGSLSQIYTGAARTATATTSPAGKTVTFTYNGSATVPTNAGDYTVVGTITDTNYAGNATGTLAVAKAAGTVTLGGLSKSYTGAAQSATATTSPAGKTVTFTYNGSATVPTNAASYTVVGTISDTNYAGNSTGTMVIAKVNQTALTVTATTPQTMGVAQTLSLSGGSGTGAVTYAVVAQSATDAGSIAGAILSANVGTGWVDIQVTKALDTNYNASTSVSKRINFAKANATITLGNLAQTYDGTAKAASTATVPGSLPLTLTYNGSATVPTAAGSYALIATINDTNYSGSATGTLTINAAPQAVIISPAAPSIAYGESVTLTASGANNGYVWSGAATGTSTSVTFASTSVGTFAATVYSLAGGNYLRSADSTAQITVSKVTPTGTFAGKTVSGPYTLVAGDLNASFAHPFNGSVAAPTGSVTYSPAAGTTLPAGTHTITATYAGNANYNSTVATATFVVNKSTPTITWNPASIYYGQPLGGGQLNATASVAGVFQYTPNTGSIATPVGSKSLSVSFTPTDTATYYSTSKTVNVTVTAAPQTITFAAIANRSYGSPPFFLGALASSGLPVSYAVSGPASLSGSVLKITGAGTVTVTATQAGNGNYQAAPAVARTFTVSKATQTIAFSHPSTTNYFLNGAASSGLPITYGLSSTGLPLSNPSEFQIQNSTLFYTGNSTNISVRVTASQAGDANYEAATNIVHDVTTASLGWISRPPLAPPPGGTSYPLRYTVDGAYQQVGEFDNPYAVDVGIWAQSPSGTWQLISQTTGPRNNRFMVSGSISFPTAGVWTVQVVAGSTSGSPLVRNNSGGSTEPALIVNVSNDQTIVFADPGTRNVGDAPYNLGAYATSGLPITYTVSGPASIAGSMLSVTGPGVVTVTASQPGTALVHAAPSVTYQFNIATTPRLTVDNFTAPTTTGGNMSGSGWALDYQDGAPVSVRVLVDGLELPEATVTTGLGRPDVRTVAIANNWSVKETLNSGWSFTFNTGVLLYGSHEVRLKAVNSLGYSTLSGPYTFTGGTPGLVGQTIVFDPITPKNVGEQFYLNAASSSNLPLTYSIVSGSGLITLTDRSVLVGSTFGTVTIRASQAGVPGQIAPAANVDRTFIIGNADADGDGMTDAWEQQFGLTDPNADADGDGVSNLEEFRLWRNPTFAEVSSSEVAVTVPVVISVMGYGTGTVDLTIDGVTSRFKFQPSAGQTWTSPLPLEAGFVTALIQRTNLGKTYTVAASSTVSDFIVSAHIDSSVAPYLQSKVELGGNYSNAMTKSEVGSSFTLRAINDGDVPFAMLDSSQLETRRIVTLGLGSSRTGQTPGRLVYHAGNFLFVSDATPGFTILKGPAFEQTYESSATPSHTQLKVPAGYVDITRQRSDITVKYYVGSFSPSGSYINFGSTTPIATYVLSGSLSSGAGSITRTVGGITTVLEHEVQLAMSESGPDTTVDSGNVMQTWDQATVATARTWGWRTVSAPRGTVTEVKVSTHRTKQSFNYGPPGYTYQPVNAARTRYLGASTASAVGDFEQESFGMGDFWLVSSYGITRGIGADQHVVSSRVSVTGYTDANGASLSISPSQTTNTTGGGTFTEYYSPPALLFGVNNLGTQPALAIGEPKYLRQSVGDDPVRSSTDVITTYTYGTNPVDGKVAMEASVTKKGTTDVGAAAYTYTTGSLNGLTTVKMAVTTYANTARTISSVSKVTKYSRRVANLDFRDKPLSVENPDNTKISYAYKVVGSDLMVAELNGKVNASGAINAYAGVAVDPLDMDANRSTVTERLFSAEGRLKSEATYVFQGGSTFALLGSVTYSYDSQGHLTAKTDSSGRVLYNATYTGLRKDSETDEQGITLTYTYDNYDRVLTMKRAAAADGLNTIAETTTTYTYDQAGRLQGEAVSGSGITDTLVTSYTFDTASRPKTRTLPGNLKTTIAYTSPKITATTLPGGGTKIEEFYADGRQKSTTGTAVTDSSSSYAYDASTGNLKTTQATAGQSVTTESDWLGRTLSATTATFSGGTRVVSSSYNSLGQLERQETRSASVEIAPAHVFTYDGYGRLFREGLKTVAGTTLDGATDYDVKEYEFAFQTNPPSDSTNLYRYEGVKIWPFAAPNASTSRYASQTYAQVTGLGATTVSHSVSLDFDRNRSDTTAVLDRAGKKLTTSTTANGTTATLQQVTLNGLSIKVTNAQGQTTLQTYDPLGRLSAISDARIDPVVGVTSYDYPTDSTLVEMITGTDNRGTRFTYDSAGRVQSKTDTAGTAYFQYDDTGKVTHQWGTTVNPVKYVYNELGQEIEMYTYRAGTWNSSTFPTASFATGGDKTTWTYQAATGLLISKQDSVNPVTSYDYNALGQVKQRTDSRGWITNYEYNDVRKLLTKIDYTGTAATYTTDVVYTYDRAGRVASVLDGSGTRSFSFYDTGTGADDSDLANKSARPKTETLSSYFGSHVLTYDYQYAVAGRNNGATTGVKLDTGSLYAVAYGYDAVMRLNSVTYNSGTPFSYGYVPNSNLIDTVSQGASGYLRDYDYESNSNRLFALKHGWGTDTLKAVESRLTYNPAGLRNTEKTQGSNLMTALNRTGVHTDYSYSPRAELEDSGKYQLSGWGAGGPIGGTIRSYDYDAIGNRTADQAGAYTPNALNQYTAAPGFGTFSYDANGNLKADGVRSYDYDAENRLIKVTQGGSIWNYEYDYLGRRIRKSGTGMTEIRFVYDGWNLIAELSSSGTLGRKFAWGLDVSGSLQGAGGVGGLLTLDTGSVQYRPIYDASHNVVGLYDGSGALAAAYEYDPFGNLQGMSAGGYSAANPFRSATKYTDSKIVSNIETETGLVYYGHRYYSSSLGRFINRDPIEEAGGLNLYGFCGNDGVNRYDYLGNNVEQPNPDEAKRKEDEAKQKAAADKQKADDEKKRKLDQAEMEGRRREAISLYGIAGFVSHGGTGNDESEGSQDVKAAGKQARADAYYNSLRNFDGSKSGSFYGDLAVEVPLAGGFAAAVLDTATGATKLVIGILLRKNNKVAEGAYAWSVGASNLQKIVRADIKATVVGHKGHAIAIRNAVNEFWAKPTLSSAADLALTAAIPAYGNFGGRGWGTAQTTDISKALNFVDFNSALHDREYGRPENPDANKEWVFRNYSPVPPDQVAPGPSGIYYVLKGTLPFLIAP